MEIVVNECYGGFGLSVAAIKRYAELAGITLYPHISSFPVESVTLTTWENAEKVGTGRPNLCFATAQCATPDELESHYWAYRDVKRDDPHLVAVVKELGKTANGSHANLRVTVVPDDVEWTIEEYDGQEWVAEAHRTW